MVAGWHVIENSVMRPPPTSRFTSHQPVPIFQPRLSAASPPAGQCRKRNTTEHIVISIIAGAFSAGVVHVLSGPDHLAAVAPLSLDSRRRAWVTGVRWGIGHSAGVLLVGLLSLALRGVLPVNALSSWAERLVGVTLLGIGIWGLRSALTRHVHVHEHSHDGQTHAHIHIHGHATAHSNAAPTANSHAHTHAAFAVGTLHGLAGSSHFLGVLPALAFPRNTQAASYLIAFGLGSIVAMGVFSSVINWMTRTFASRAEHAYRVVMATCSTIALAVGVYWLAA